MLLTRFVEAGLANKTLKVVDQDDGTARYYRLDAAGKTIVEIDLADTAAILRLIETKDFQVPDAEKNPKKLADTLRMLSDAQGQERRWRSSRRWQRETMCRLTSGGSRPWASGSPNP